MIEMVMPACSIPQSVPPRLVSVRAAARISGRVKLDPLLIITRAPRNSFHDMMKANRATVTIAGIAEGMQILRRTCQDDAHSFSCRARWARRSCVGYGANRTQRSPPMKAIAFLAVALASLPAAAVAQQSELGGKVRSGQEVTVPVGETVQGDLIASAGTVRIDGRVDGDLVATGGEVTVA